MRKKTAMVESEKITVSVVAPFEPLRFGLSSAIGRSPDMHLAGEFYSLNELAVSSESRSADVVLVDVNVLRNTQGTLPESLREWLPALRVLFLGTRHDAQTFSPDDIPVFLRLSSVGFLLKDGATTRLLDAVRLVAAGVFVCEAELIKRMLTRLSEWAAYTEDGRPTHLSTREGQVLRLLVRGLSNKEIAQELFLSEGTVKVHVSRIMTKLNVARRADLVRYALTEGLVGDRDESPNGDGAGS